MIIILNGPPGSGKDFLGNAYQHHSLNTIIKKFAQPIRDIVCALLNIVPTFLENGKKLRVMPFDVSIRQLMIDVSEKWMKPCYGADIFGMIAARDLELYHVPNDREHTIIYTDGGFAEEVKTLADCYDASNIVIVRLYRDGCTFDGDSRSYYNVEGVKTVDFYNMGGSASITEFIALIDKLRKEHENVG